MTDLNITIKQASVQKSVPTYVETLNFNSEALKAEIEELVNAFRLDSENRLMGDADTPVVKLTTRGISMLQNGLSYLNADDEEVASLTIDGEGDSVLVVDRVEASGLIVSSEMELDQVTVSDLLKVESTGTLDVNGIADFAMAVQESLDLFTSSGSWLSVDYDPGTKVGQVGFELKSTSSGHNYLVVNAESDADLYDAGWQDSNGRLHINVNIDAESQPRNGQVFDVCLAQVVNNAGTDLTGDLVSENISVRLYAGDGEGSPSSGDVVFSDGATYLDLSNEGVFRSNVKMQYWFDSVNDEHVLHVISSRGATFNY